MSRPLYKKLGIEANSEIALLNAPEEYLSFFHDFPESVVIHFDLENETLNFIHLFAKTNEELVSLFRIAKKHVSEKGMIWVSWPKKSSKVESEIDQMVVMKHGLAQGLVDVKIVSVSEVWSGHKFVYRLQDRKGGK